MQTHFAIPALNLEQSQSFYEKLGFSVITRWEKTEQGLRAVKMENSNGAQIELVYHSGNTRLAVPKIPEVLHIGIQVANLSDALVALADDGCEIITPITKGVSVRHFAFLKDPNGFPVELFERNYPPFPSAYRGFPE